MKTFIKRLIVFMAIILLPLLVLEISIRQIPNSYALKDKYIKTHGSKVENLILGSSHTFYGVSPKFFSAKTFNASNISQSPALDLAILESYANEWSKLKVVIIRLSYDTLFEQLKETNESWRLKNYKLYTSIDFDFTYKQHAEILAMGSKQSLKTIKKYYLDNIPLLDCDSLGWGNDLKDKQKPDLIEAGEIVAKRHTAKSWALLDQNISNFKHIMNWCKSSGIKVLLVTPPAFKSYTQNLDGKQLDKMIEVGQMLDLQHTNCKYVNFINDSNFGASDFFDADHLNTEGAKKFSTILNQLILDKI